MVDGERWTQWSVFVSFEVVAKRFCVRHFIFIGGKSIGNWNAIRGWCFNNRLLFADNSWQLTEHKNRIQLVHSVKNVIALMIQRTADDFIFICCFVFFLSFRICKANHSMDKLLIWNWFENIYIQRLRIRVSESLVGAIITQTINRTVSNIFPIKYCDLLRLRNEKLESKTEIMSGAGFFFSLSITSNTE